MWPFAGPPIEGLQGIIAMLSMYMQSSSVLAPILEDASAASQPRVARADDYNVVKFAYFHLFPHFFILFLQFYLFCLSLSCRPRTELLAK